ncbi:MAG: radical SAM protein, partial [Campylobacterota bacterium]
MDQILSLLSTSRPKNTMIINWILTRKCNYSCTYCGSYQNTQEFEPFDKIKKAILQIKMLNKKHYRFTLSGGEPTLHPQYIKIVESIYKELGNTAYINTITNLSRSKTFYEKLINRLHVYRKNLVFDTSYHFEFANFDQFITNCKLLSEN